MSQRGYNVLLVRPELNRYGVAKSMLCLAQGLLARGHKVCCAAQAGPRIAAQWGAKGATFYDLRLGVALGRLSVSTLREALALMRIVQRERIDIVHSHHRQSSLLMWLLQPLTRSPVVTTCHGILSGRRRFTVWGERVICVSRDTQRHVIEYFGVKPRQTVVIENGLDTAFWQGLHERGSSPVQNSGVMRGPCLISMARLSVEKDQMTLLKALALIRRGHPEARLLLVGAGPMEAELRTAACHFGIASAVEFVGEVEDVVPALAQADVFVLCSTTEGLPMAMLEAMAAGVPVVATAVGGIPRLVRHHATGCLVPPGDPERLAEEIGFVHANPRQAEGWAEEARRLVEREFSLERMALQTEQVYREVLDGRGRP